MKRKGNFVEDENRNYPQAIDVSEVNGETWGTSG